jgi:cell wall-associated NlpC family hydrolase
MSAILVGIDAPARRRLCLDSRRAIGKGFRCLFAGLAATAALTMAPTPRAAADGLPWATEAERVLADARQHIGQHPYGAGDGSNTKSGVTPQLMNVIPAYDGVNGMDCVGFVYVVFAETDHLGKGRGTKVVDQRRDVPSMYSYYQSPTTRPSAVSFDGSVLNWQQKDIDLLASPGDIVIFKKDDGKGVADSTNLRHVAIYAGGGHILHMSGVSVQEANITKTPVLATADDGGKAYRLAALVHTYLYYRNGDPILPISGAIPAGPFVEANAMFDVTGSYTPDGTGLTYHPLDRPWRAMDTRPATHVGSLVTFTSQRVQTLSLASGLPANAAAVTGNLTATQSSTVGWVAVAPAGLLTSGVQPAFSTVTFGKGETRSNAVTMAVNSNGLDFMEWVSGTTTATVNLVFDVTGYFTSDGSGLGYHPLASPTRSFEQEAIPALTVVNKHVLDTSGQMKPVAVTGVVSVYCAKPSNCVTGGYITVARGGTLGDGSEARPYNVWFQPEEWRSNSVTVPLDANGNLDFWWQPYHVKGDLVKINFDVTGYFTDYPTDQTGMTYHPLETRVRVIDTRGHYWTSLINGFHQDRTMPAPFDQAGALTGNLTVYQMACRGFVLMAAQGSLQDGQPLGSMSLALQGDLVDKNSNYPLRETDYTVGVNQGQVALVYAEGGTYCRTD